MRWIERQWHRVTPASFLLLPLAALYCLIVLARVALYRLGVLRALRVGAPVIVVGNITVGGTGKTPLVIWVAHWLRARGYRPGIVTRGYRGVAESWPLDVTGQTDVGLCGDEPLLLARRAACPVVADPKRARGAERLVRTHACNVVVSDDGLQHYALARDVEIAVVDGARRFGNGLCLPAGPLREPVRRLRWVNAVVTQGTPRPGEIGMTLGAEVFRRLATGETATAGRFASRRVHAVAAIGNPARFFGQLRQLGLEPIEHPFPDHHGFAPADLAFGDDAPVIMTEKDAVKCERFADNDWWYLEVSAEPGPTLAEVLAPLLKEYARG
jgi:tetraacyldisaccharide 4'-kinase